MIVEAQWGVAVLSMGLEHVMRKSGRERGKVYGLVAVVAMLSLIAAIGGTAALIDGDIHN
jgi:hypothetical protein